MSLYIHTRKVTPPKKDRINSKVNLLELEPMIKPKSSTLCFFFFKGTQTNKQEKPDDKKTVNV